MTATQLRALGCTLNPDGSWTAPGAHSHATKTNPPRPVGVSHSQPQQPPAKTLAPLPQGQASGQGRPVLRTPRFRLTIVRFSARLLDADNFAGGCKALIDAVRREKLIPDDDPRSVEIIFRQERDTRANARTELTIEELSC